MRVSQVALDGLSLRQQAISRNVANVDTPGYKAQTVDFEKTLKQMISRDNTLQLTKTNPAHLVSKSMQAGYTLSNRPDSTMRADQNDVNIDLELQDQAETGIQYQAVEQAVSKKLALLKTLAR